MANAATKLFAAFMEAQGVKCHEVNEEEGFAVVGWTLENTKIMLIFKFGDDNNDVHIIGRDFIKVKEEKYADMYKVINDCNKKYRWVKFVLDEENGEIRAEDDAVIQLDSCAQEAFELMIRMNHVVDDAYPSFMKALWS